MTSNCAPPFSYLEPGATRAGFGLRKTGGLYRMEPDVDRSLPPQIKQETAPIAGNDAKPDVHQRQFVLPTIKAGSRENLTSTPETRTNARFVKANIAGSMPNLLVNKCTSSAGATPSHPVNKSTSAACAAPSQRVAPQSRYPIDIYEYYLNQDQLKMPHKSYPGNSYDVQPEVIDSRQIRSELIYANLEERQNHIYEAYLPPRDPSAHEDQYAPNQVAYGAHAQQTGCSPALCRTSSLYPPGTDNPAPAYQSATYSGHTGTESFIFLKQNERSNNPPRISYVTEDVERRGGATEQPTDYPNFEHNNPVLDFANSQVSQTHAAQTYDQFGGSAVLSVAPQQVTTGGGSQVHTATEYLNANDLLYTPRYYNNGNIAADASRRDNTSTFPVQFGEEPQRREDNVSARSAQLYNVSDGREDNVSPKQQYGEASTRGYNISDYRMDIPGTLYPDPSYHHSMAELLGKEGHSSCIDRRPRLSILVAVILTAVVCLLIAFLVGWFGHPMNPPPPPHDQIWMNMTDGYGPYGTMPDGMR